MQNQLTGLICKNGHQLDSQFLPGSGSYQKYCDYCGEETLPACTNCKAPLFSRKLKQCEESADSPGSTVYASANYCRNCGAAFPWTMKKIMAAQQFADEIDQLDADERRILKASVVELTRDTPLTELAATRIKKLIKKTAPQFGEALNNILVNVATEAAKKSLGL